MIWVNWLQKKQIAQIIRIFRTFLTVFPLFNPKSEALTSLFAHLLFFKEPLEKFASVALYKRVNVSDLFRSLMTKSDRSAALFLTSKSLFRFFDHKKEWIDRKTDERIPNPDTVSMTPWSPKNTGNFSKFFLQFKETISPNWCQCFVHDSNSFWPDFHGLKAKTVLFRGTVQGFNDIFQ